MKTIATLAFFLPFPIQAAGLIEVPDPLGTKNPVYLQQNLSFSDVGQSYLDPSFGSPIQRLTNANVEGSRHEYSRFDPYNKDQSKIILNGDGGRANVYATQTYPYNAVSNKLYDLPVVEARWDRNDTNRIWGLSGSSIKTVDFNANSNSPTLNLVNDFSKNNYLTNRLGYRNFYITMKDEGEASYDQRYWAFIVQDYNSDKRHIVTWDKEMAGNSQGGVLGTYELTGRERNIDWVGMSPKGSHVLIGGLDYSADETKQNITGLTMATKNLNRFHRLDYTTAHADVGLDKRGNEVVIMQNTRTDAIDLIPIDWQTQAIKKTPLPDEDAYAGTNRTELVNLHYSSLSPHSFDLLSGVHISANYDGYTLISTTTPLQPGEENENNWLERSIILVELDSEKPITEYLAKTYNTSNAYWQETHGTITNDGKRFLWAANNDLIDNLTGGNFDNFLFEGTLDNPLLESKSLKSNSNAVPLPPAFLLLSCGLLCLPRYFRKKS